MSTDNDPSEGKRHGSELAEPRQRFLSRVVEHCLTEGLRTPEDFLRHFPPADLVVSLASADALRVKLLVAATGTHEKIALKKSAASASEDLVLALAEQTTTPAALVALYPADDKVRYLDARKLWAFAVEDEFFRATPSEDGGRHARGAMRLHFMLECALSEQLLTLRDIADGVTFDAIAEALPVAELREVVKHALTISRASAPLTEERLLAVVPLLALVGHVPLEHTWNHVVLEKIANLASFVGDSPAPAPAAVEAAVAPVPATEAPGATASPEAEPAVPSQGARVPDEDEVRRRVLERLRVIDRLPPNNGALSTALMLSIESMYAELWALGDDEDREACIRESFPNQSLLRTAMLALIELLDPTVDTRDPIIHDAEIAGLVKIVLFEERRRRDAAPPSPRPSSVRQKRSVPPPLPRASTPPPLPVEVSGVGNRSSIPPAPSAEAAKRDA